MKQNLRQSKNPARFRFSVTILPILCLNLEIIGKRNETEFETYGFWFSVKWSWKKSCDQTVKYYIYCVQTWNLQQSYIISCQKYAKSGKEICTDASKSQIKTVW